MRLIIHRLFLSKLPLPVVNYTNFGWMQMSRYNWNNMWIVFHCYWIQTHDWKAVSKASAPLEIVYRVCSKFRKSWLKSTLHQTIANCTFRLWVLMFWWKKCKQKLAQTQNGLECTFNGRHLECLELYWVGSLLNLSPIMSMCVLNSFISLVLFPQSVEGFQRQTKISTASGKQGY